MLHVEITLPEFTAFKCFILKIRFEFMQQWSHKFWILSFWSEILIWRSLNEVCFQTAYPWKNSKQMTMFYLISLKINDKNSLFRKLQHNQIAFISWVYFQDFRESRSTGGTGCMCLCPHQLRQKGLVAAVGEEARCLPALLPGASSCHPMQRMSYCGWSPRTIRQLRYCSHPPSNTDQIKKCTSISWLLMENTIATSATIKMKQLHQSTCTPY